MPNTVAVHEAMETYHGHGYFSQRAEGGVALKPKFTRKPWFGKLSHVSAVVIVVIPAHSPRGHGHGVVGTSASTRVSA